MFFSLLWSVCSNQHVAFYSKKESLEKRLGLPEKPKHPLNSFLRFSIDARNKLASSNLKPQEASIKLGVMWKNLSENEKQKYVATYKREYVRNISIHYFGGFSQLVFWTFQDEYVQKLNAYNSRLTNEQKQQLKAERLKELREKNVTRTVKEKVSERKNRLQQLGKPKRPLSSFLLFLSDERKKTSGKIVLSDIKEKWYKLSDAQRSAYVEAAAKSFDAYKYVMQSFSIFYCFHYWSTAFQKANI